MAQPGVSLIETVTRELESVRRNAGNGNAMDSAEQAKQELEQIEQQIRHLENIAGENQEARKQLQVLHTQIEALRRQMTRPGPWQKTELARLIELGARPVDIGQGDVAWHVLADPEGNEFCLLRSTPSQVAALQTSPTVHETSWRAIRCASASSAPCRPCR